VTFRVKQLAGDPGQVSLHERFSFSPAFVPGVPRRPSPFNTPQTAARVELSFDVPALARPLPEREAEAAAPSSGWRARLIDGVGHRPPAEKTSAAS